MKLYTKEMFLIAAKKCEVSMIDAEHIMKYIDEYVSPIELPIEEEVYKQAYLHSYLNELPDENAVSYIEGANFVINQIKNNA